MDNPRDAIRDITPAEEALIRIRQAEVRASEERLREAAQRHRRAQAALQDVLAALAGGDARGVEVDDRILYRNASPEQDADRVEEEVRSALGNGGGPLAEASFSREANDG